jgi:hypothetical protein
MKKYLLFLIENYQKLYIKGGVLYHRSNVCVFQPSCSEYTKQSIEKYGAIKGVVLGVKRVVRCNPINGRYGVQIDLVS